MDPVDLEQLLHELRSVYAETVTVPLASLTPGCVIAASSPWHRHLVTDLPAPLGGNRLAVAVRHLHGGHNVVLSRSADETIEIYRHRLAAAQIGHVPVVPRCVVPDRPMPGDRVFHHLHDVQRLGEGRFFEYTGFDWQQVTDIVDRGRVRPYVRTFPDGIRHIVSNPAEPNPLGWYTYVPAGHRPALHVDGMPMPARTVDELAVGDTIRIPGRGKLQVTELRRHSSATTLVVTLVQQPVHPMRHFLWDRSEGAVVEHHDSGRTRTLYPTEPRPSELVDATALDPGDTVITSWNRPYSNVTTVQEVWGQPLLGHMNVNGTTRDGCSVRIVTGESRFLLLHRPAVVHARAGWWDRAKAHAA